MKTFQCSCGNTLFFGSTRCVGCGAKTGMCEACLTVTPVDNNQACLSCNAIVVECANRAEKVCNVWTTTQGPCRFCATTTVIPDLAVEENREKWRLLEAAKRRVLVGVEAAGFPPGDTPGELPLTFEFKADGAKKVATGHADGCITINLREADPVHREKTRVEFNEPQRTLVGHFRHELGHYYWQRLVEPHCLEAFRSTFGDETKPSYADAQQAYYKTGPKPDWRQSYISGYATMHPWEDFAETFGAYIDMTTIMATATHFQILSTPDPQDFASLIRAYGQVGVIANELNRDMGLLDLVPEIFHAPVKEKLNFMHNLAIGAVAT